MNPTPTLPASPCALAKGPLKLGFGWLSSLSICVPMMLITALLILFGPTNDPSLAIQLRVARLLVWALINSLFFVMVKTGRTDKYRSALFIMTAISFALTFMPNLIAVRGSMLVERPDLIDGKIPMCHIVIPMLLIPAALKQTIIFPGSLVHGFASIGTMVVLWLGATLALGRGWCSWVCFYGGFDEGCSRFGKKSWLRSIDHRWTYLPVAILLAVMLLSAASLSPTYCEWVCPFRAVSEFEKVTTFKLALQALIFIALFLAFVVVLPFLTKKRTQCSLLCPMGVFQGWTNHLTLHRIAIDRERCTACKLCVKGCPTLSLTPESVAAGRALTSCTKCGRCVDTCPKGAISYHVKGTKLQASPRLARVLFLYPAVILLGTIGGSMMVGALIRIFKLVTTGSML